MRLVRHLPGNVCKFHLCLYKKWVSHPWRNGLRCIGFILDVSVEYVVLETSAPGARFGDPCHGNDALELRAHLTRVLSNPGRGGTKNLQYTHAVSKNFLLYKKVFQNRNDLIEQGGREFRTWSTIKILLSLQLCLISENSTSLRFLSSTWQLSATM